MSNCRRCLTEKTQVTANEDEVRRIARQMARASLPSKLSTLKEHLAIAKANRTQAREQMEQSHECDTLLSDEHWTKKRA